MTEQLLVSFLSPPVTAGGGPFLSVIGGYLAVFMLQRSHLNPKTDLQASYRNIFHVEPLSQVHV